MPRIELPSPYKVEILLDSLAPCGARFTTFVCTYWRAVHSELMTHKMLSKSSASSRAIPTAKLRALVRNTPALPYWWGKNEPGMQARAELDTAPFAHATLPGIRAEDGWPHALDCFDGESVRAAAQRVWLEGRDSAIKLHEKLERLGLHKQVCNRVLEPWMPITVIISGTDWQNFFHLRDHKDAMPEIQIIATEMHYQYLASKPYPVAVGDWHRPFIDSSTWEDVGQTMFGKSYRGPIEPGMEEAVHEGVLRVSAARCARISYLNHDGVRSVADDLKLYDRLVRRDDPREPIHSAPLEHVAQALPAPERIGNARGWKQLRKTLPHEAGPPEPLWSTQ